MLIRLLNFEYGRDDFGFLLPKTESLVLFQVISHLFDIRRGAFGHEQIVFGPNLDGSINQLVHGLIRDQIDAVVRRKRAFHASFCNFLFDKLSKQSWKEA